MKAAVIPFSAVKAWKMTTIAVFLPIFLKRALHPRPRLAWV
jgi:hypothetical protein